MTNENNKALATTVEEPLAIAPSDMDMARALVASGFFPSVKSASQALVKIQAGKELGFGAVASMMGIHIIQTQSQTSVQLSANMLANLVRRHGAYDFEVIEHDDDHCAIRFTRGARAIGESRFSMADAKRAGLAEREVWKKFPKNMLYAAAMRNGAKWFCAEVLLGAPMPVSDSEPEAGAVDLETGEVFEGETMEGVPVVSAPPEGYKPSWDAFWATARDLGLTREDVHGYFGVPAKNGALKEWAEARATDTEPLTQVVAVMTVRLEIAAADKRQASVDRQNAPYQRGARKGEPVAVTTVQGDAGGSGGAGADKQNGDCCWMSNPCSEHAPDREPDPKQETPEELAERIAEERRLATEATQGAMLPPDPKSKAHP